MFVVRKLVFKIRLHIGRGKGQFVDVSKSILILQDSSVPGDNGIDIVSVAEQFEVQV